MRLFPPPNPSISRGKRTEQLARHSNGLQSSIWGGRKKDRAKHEVHLTCLVDEDTLANGDMIEPSNTNISFTPNKMNATSAQTCVDSHRMLRLLEERCFLSWCAGIRG